MRPKAVRPLISFGCVLAWTSLACAAGDPPTLEATFAPEAAAQPVALATSLALSGDLAFVGAPGHQPAGGVFVYQRVGTSWRLAQLLTPPIGTPAGGFGGSLDADGNLLAVGVAGDDELGTNAGRVYVFELDQGQFVLTAELVGQETDAGDRFGSDVAVSGERIAVGAEGDEWLPDLQFPENQTGAAYIFEKLPDWTEVARIVPDGGGYGGDLFGFELDLDGEVLAIGAPAAKPPISAINSGALFVFEPVNGVWSQTSLLTPPGQPTNFVLGVSVAIDQGRILAGAPGGGAGGGFLSWPTGVAYMFERVGPSFEPWVETAQLAPTAGITTENHQFGASVALDGARALVGGVFGSGGGQGTFGAGTAWLYEWDDQAGWVHVASFQGDPSAGYGRPLSLSGDRVAIGSPFADESGPGSGSVELWDTTDVCCPQLVGSPTFVSLIDGGVHDLRLTLGSAYAGAPYLILGSAGSTAPGIPVDGVVLPLEFDSYFLWTVTSAGQAPFSGTVGLLDAGGQASANLSVPANLSLDLAGAALNHAALVFSATTGAAVLATEISTLVLVD